MAFVGQTGCEVEGVGIAGAAPAEYQGPEGGVHNRRARLILDLAAGVSGSRVKRVDGPISKVADENVVAECAEVGTGLNDAPGRIERCPLFITLYEVSF